MPSSCAPRFLRSARSRCRSGPRPARADFDMFLPRLRRNLELRQPLRRVLRRRDEPYDVLLDDFEPGMKTAEVRDVFDEAEGAARCRSSRRSRAASGDDGLAGHVPDRAAEGIRAEGGRALRLRPQRMAARPGRPSVRDRRGHDRHPAHDALLRGQPGRRCSPRCTSAGTGSTSTASTRELERTLLARGASLGLHESQSRMWENLVGRSLPFWRFFYPQLREDSRRRSATSSWRASTARSTGSSRR